MSDQQPNQGTGQQPKQSTGLQPNVAGLLCYVLGWVTGIVFLIIEKEDKTVRFHAMQSIVVFGGYTIVSIILNFIPFIGWILNTIIGIIVFILWIVLMVRAYQGNVWKVPWAGNFAESLLKSGSGTKQQ
jgi:uncharacterized membrane protein